MQKIIFQKAIKKEGYCCVDMHIHSVYSKDSNNSVKDIVMTARYLGIGIAICDHDEIKGSIEASKYNVFIIPGIEITTKEDFHIPIYFYTFSDLQKFFKKVVAQHSKDHLPIDTLIKEARTFNCVITLAHPYRILSVSSFHTKKKKILKISEKVDCVEVINSKNFHRENVKALQLSSTGVTGGSDAHCLHEIGLSATYVKNCKTVKKFLDNVKKGNAFVIGTETTFIKKISPAFSYVQKKITKLIH